MILLLHMFSLVAKFVECSREEFLQANAQSKSIFALFVKYSHEKNMVDVIFFGSTVGLHRISNEVRRNKFYSLLLFF